MENYNGITRRDILKGAAAAGLGTALGGCMLGPQLSNEMQEYMDSHDFQAYAVLVSQKGEKSRVQVRGWNKGEQYSLEGSIESQSRRLDIPLETILRKAKKTGADFGYATGTALDTPETQAEVKNKSFELLSRESRMNLTDYFPSGAVNNEQDQRVSKSAYHDLLNSGELKVVRVVYVATPKKAEPAKPAKK